MFACTTAVALLAAACSSTATSSGATSGAASPSGHPTTHRHTTGLIGKIHNVSSSNLAIDVHGTTKTVSLTSSTTYRQGHHTIPVSTLAPGERVRVQLSSGTTAKVVTVLPASLSGTVTATAAQGFTLHSAHGTITQVTTSSSTTYRKGSKAVTVGALKDGDKVRVQGQPGTSGSFAASKVIVASGG